MSSLRGIERAAGRSAQLILLLNREHSPESERYRKLGATVVHVEDLEDFPDVAASLTRALFGVKEAA